MKHLPTVLMCCLSLLTLSACGSGDRPEEQAPAPQPAAADPPLPDIVAGEGEGTGKPEVPTLRVTTIDGTEYDLAEHRGKWVVVNFWATWCSPCLKEMPELSALDAMREDIEVVGLAYEDIAPAELQAFLKQHPVVYPIAIADVYAPPAAFDPPRGLPATWLIAPDGRVARQFLGPVTAAELEAAVAQGAPAVSAPAGAGAR